MLFEIVKSDHPYLLYSIGFIFFYQSYFLFDKILKVGSYKYRALSEEKQMYTVSNLLKSFLLAGITPGAGYILYNSMAKGIWDNTMITNIGILYSIPDGVSLILVKKMETSTKIHHLIVCLFNFMNIYVDHSSGSIMGCVLIYACFSTFAFMVNFMLGVRFLTNNKKMETFLARISFLIYTSCCLINWTWTSYYMKSLYNKCDDWSCGATFYIFGILFSNIVYDDIVLNRWLYRKSNFKYHGNSNILSS